MNGWICKRAKRAKSENENEKKKNDCAYTANRQFAIDAMVNGLF